MSRLTIYCDQISPRLSYACELLFANLMLLEYELQVRPDSLAELNETAIYYGIQPPDGVSRVSIHASGLLAEHEIRPVDIQSRIHPKREIPVLFVHPEDDLLGYDVFSAVFYMVSRYEEYLPFTPDAFGRFPEKNSISSKLGFTQIPIVHHWARHLQETLQKSYPNLKLGERGAKVLFTYDIDVAYAYRGRSFATQVASLAKNVFQRRFDVIQNKWKHRFGSRSDPSDTYDLIEENPFPVMYFMLLAAKRSSYDRNLSPEAPLMKKLIGHCKSKGAVGIHPSYFSIEHPNCIREEKDKLSSLTHAEVTQSRQHYLRFRLPDTYRALIAAGITEDYSMQYPEMPGFRAGICIPYPFFDVSANKVTALTLFPGCIMETTFRDDLHLPAKDAWEWYQALWKAVSEVQGTFISIWHNDTLWKDQPDEHPLAFRQIHQKLIHHISTMLTNAADRLR